MTDINIAYANLSKHSICFCKDGEFFTDDGRGISPMIRLINEDRDLRGYSVADIIVGKAVALLFVKAGIKEVFGKVMSFEGRNYLLQHNVCCTWDILTKKIINRTNDGICPMEEAVENINDADEAYLLLSALLEDKGLM